MLLTVEAVHVYFRPLVTPGPAIITCRWTCSFIGCVTILHWLHVCSLNSTLVTRRVQESAIELSGGAQEFYLNVFLAIGSRPETEK